MINEKTVEGLSPESFWKHLAQIAEIPRESGNEAGVREYILMLARKNILDFKTDKKGNLLVIHRASVGMEHLPSVALQGHLDMVCEKNSGSSHDFTKDPIHLIRNGNILKADGTSAGFDNGVGIAAMCMLMEDTIPHGRREYLFTVEEETGLFGANELKSDFISSNILINLDTEESGKLYIGCAGGKQSEGTITPTKEKIPTNYRKCILSIAGLKGGHSGCDINENRGNAIKLLMNVFEEIHAVTDPRISHIEGGSKHNAIPREAKVHFHVPEDQIEKIKLILESAGKLIKDKHSEQETEISLEFSVDEKNMDTHVFSLEFQGILLQSLSELPHGVHKMSEDVPGLVETSSNLAKITQNDDILSIMTSHRSLADDELKKICVKINDIFERNGFTISNAEGYPAWTPNIQSPILKKAITIYESLYGEQPEVKAIHAGLECGIIGEKFPGIDMISVGPTIKNPHSPDEFLEIDTIPKFLEFLRALLSEIK